MSIVRQGTLPVGSLDHAITLNVQSSGGSHFETVTSTTPYLHRASPQDVASSMKLKKVVGGTIAWNQLMDDTWSVNLDVANNPRAVTKALPNGSSIRTGHKYLYSFMVSSKENVSHSFGASLYTKVNNVAVVATGINNNTSGFRYTVFQSAYDATSDGTHTSQEGNLWLYISLSATDTNGKATISHINLIDLTQMFGSTIADYIYSLEQAHAGDGVAWFKALFGEDYYPYNAGELLSVKTSARKTYNADNVEIGSYALDDNLELRGIPKLDSNNELYYDGDTYASDGTVTRRYGVVDLGTLHWTKLTDAVWNCFTTAIPTKLGGSRNCICSKYTRSAIYNTTNDKCIDYNGTNKTIYIRDSSYSDAPSFTTAMDGVYLVYELATSTTESADAYTESQRVGATEEFVDGRTVEMPVGNVSEYKRLIQEDEP